MYKGKYNIDSLFPDSVAKISYINNPFIVEFPQLRNYAYQPIFRVSNMKMQECYSHSCYLKNVYEVVQFYRFIRPANLDLGIVADTLYKPAYNVFDGTGVTERDRYFAVYYKKGQPMRMVGGSAFLTGFPEPVEISGNVTKKLIAEILVRTRLIGRIAVFPDERDDRLFLGFIKNSLDTIGSFSNGLRFFVPDWPTVAGKSPTTIGRYNLLSRDFVLFYFTKKSFERSRINQEPKLIIVPFPLYRKYSYEIPGLDRDLPSTVLKEPWNQIDVFSIYFTTDLDNQYKNARFGYVPGFYAYEVKQTFKNKPEVPEDNFPRIRGMSKEEFEGMKAKPYVKVACHEGKL